MTPITVPSTYGSGWITFFAEMVVAVEVAWGSVAVGPNSSAGYENYSVLVWLIGQDYPKLVKTFRNGGNVEAQAYADELTKRINGEVTE